jgi:hypothetical protein
MPPPPADAQDGGDLLLAEIQEVLQREHLTLAAGQRADRGEQCPAVLTRQH